MKDISSYEDIKSLIDTFYNKAIHDPKIGPFFVNLDFDKHMPIMYQFWESTLLGKHNYKGNPIEVHRKLNSKHPMTKEHFNQWISLFEETVDRLFAGPTAEVAKTRATSISTVMQIKIQGN